MELYTTIVVDTSIDINKALDQIKKLFKKLTITPPSQL